MPRDSALPTFSGRTDDRRWGRSDDPGGHRHQHGPTVEPHRVERALAAAGGLFSVQSYTVSRRRREFGIRTALGASPRAIRRLVLRDGMAVAVVGTAFGVAGAGALARAIASLQRRKPCDAAIRADLVGALVRTKYATV